MERFQKVKISRGKFASLNACSDQQGSMAALAVDHRGNLLHEIALARGAEATAEDMHTFKAAVTRVLTPYASAILLDPEYGLSAAHEREASSGLMLAYEQSGYDGKTHGRLPDLQPTWSVRRLVEASAQAIKILLYYNPFDQTEINAIKQAYIERIGAECTALDVAFFLEPLVYDEAVGNEKGLAFARRKPLYVTQAITEFSKPRYGVDVLKVEMPINPAFTAGTRAFGGGEAAYSREEALEHFRVAANASSKPLIYLSAGVSNETFCEMLELAIESGAQFCGVLCGRAIWQDGISIYANHGTSALESWLSAVGVHNIQAINQIVAHGATAWWDAYGGSDAIEIEGQE